MVHLKRKDVHGTRVVVVFGEGLIDVRAGADTSREQSVNQGHGHIQGTGSYRRRLNLSGTSQRPSSGAGQQCADSDGS